MSAELKNENQKAREELFKTVADCVEELSHLDYVEVKKYVDEHMADEKQEIIDEFHKYFDDVPKDSPLRLKTLEVMALLGIVVYNAQEKYPEFPEDEVEEVEAEVAIEEVVEEEENDYLTMGELEK